MTDLRTAAQQALEALYEETAWFGPTPKGAAAIAALKAALAQQDEPVQEPVAWMRPDNRVAEESYSRTQFSRGRDKPPIGTWTPLYTTPPQRKPLAEWQINDLMAGIDPEDVCSWSFRQGVYAAEKHHGVKP